MTTTLRSAVAAEADQLTSLAMRSKAYWGYTAEFMDSCREELIVTDQKILAADFDFHVICVDGHLAGYYALEIQPAGNFELEALFVEPKYIGRGLGRRLLEHAVDNATCRGGESLVIQGDPNASDFYAAVGAKQIGNRESESIPGRMLPLYQLRLDDLRREE